VSGHRILLKTGMLIAALTLKTDRIDYVKAPVVTASQVKRMMRKSK